MNKNHMSVGRRRFFLNTALSMSAMALGLRSSLALAQQPVPIADMHSHFGQLSRSIVNSGLAADMKEQRIALVSWSLASDIQFIKQSDIGVTQSSVPPAGALAAFFHSRLERMRTNVQQGGARVVLTRADVDACIAGDSGVVLSAEGADFLEGKVDALGAAYEKGLRHLQLVHYIQNPIGDFQTTAPTHNGLTQVGKDLIGACNAQGILIDLAHSPGTSVDQALSISTAPMIWSHGWVDSVEGRAQDRLGYLQRRLSLEHAKKLADKGGVVGVWALGLNNPAPASEAGKGAWTAGRQDTRGYARELVSLVDRLGADHVGIGTDMEGVGPDWTVNNYAQLRKVVDHLVDMKMPADVIDRVAYKNYARILKEAFKA